MLLSLRRIRLGIGLTCALALALVAAPSAPAAMQAFKLTSGNTHTCVLSQFSGGAFCWGQNYSGQLGNTSVSSSTATPVPVTGFDSGLIDISAGYIHTCAVTETRQVLCWGSNYYGELGTGTTNNSPTMQPRNVIGIVEDVQAVAVGDYFSCALTDAGGVKCWGNILGNGTGYSSAVAVDVTGLESGVVQIAAKGSHACALTVDNEVKCWGNGTMQLGVPGATGLAPATVSGIPGTVKSLVLGYGNTCAVTVNTENTVGSYCWGNNSAGQLGDGTKTSRPTPVLSTITEMQAMGETTSCGKGYCTGAGSQGELGNGAKLSSTTAVKVTGVDDTTSMSAGSQFECETDNFGGAKCWGLGAYGALGTGIVQSATTPIQVVGAT